MKRLFGNNKEELIDPRLDEMLEHPSQQAIREVVRAIPDDTVSMAWRSQLNERLLASAPAPRTGRAWLWKSAVALGLAGAMAMAMLVKSPTITEPVQPQSDLGLTLIAAHAQTIDFTEVAGAGLPPHEAVPVNYVDDDWDDVLDWYYEL